jgi:hypothetical protein
MMGENYINLSFKCPEYHKNGRRQTELSENSVFADDSGQESLVNEHELCAANFK